MGPFPPRPRAPHHVIAQAFAAADGLRRLKAAAGHQRDALQREMVALQEETDWLVYIAYRLAGERDGVDRSR